jgi:hypothetical protein
MKQNWTYEDVHLERVYLVEVGVEIAGDLLRHVEGQKF